MQELRNIWQHVLRKKLVDGKLNIDPQVAEENALEDSECSSYSNDFNENVVGENFPEVGRDSRCGKRPRISWTLELHQKFLAAINELGIDSKWALQFPISFLSFLFYFFFFFFSVWKIFAIDFLRFNCSFRRRRGCAEEDTRSHERREPDEGKSCQPFTGMHAFGNSIDAGASFNCNFAACYVWLGSLFAEVPAVREETQGAHGPI